MKNLSGRPPLASGEAREILDLFRGSLEQEKSELVEKGWFLDNEIRIPCPDSRNNRVPSSRRICKLETNRIVAAEYDRIPLQIMADFAREAGMFIKAKLENNNDVNDKDLLPIKNKLKSYAKSGNSKPEDWHSNEQWLRSLRNKHLHFSAHYNSTGMQPRFVNGKRKRLLINYNWVHYAIPIFDIVYYYHFFVYY